MNRQCVRVDARWYMHSKFIQPSPATSPPSGELPAVQATDEVAGSGSEVRFVHSFAIRGTPLVMSICRECNIYICASARQDLLTLVERLHDCPGRFLLSL